MPDQELSVTDKIRKLDDRELSSLIEQLEIIANEAVQIVAELWTCGAMGPSLSLAVKSSVLDSHFQEKAGSAIAALSEKAVGHPVDASDAQREASIKTCLDRLPDFQPRKATQEPEMFSQIENARLRHELQRAIDRLISGCALLWEHGKPEMAMRLEKSLSVLVPDVQADVTRFVHAALHQPAGAPTPRV
ncbi:hypothetical protein ACFOY8_14575 [Thalassospira xianhensis]|uniref:Uncharacterized protein n=1 Tax=Thalassospira xianhensis MCCC 1A02616 TaxID=1177929 RepID=A0A367UHY7_9PROT|nr:hypothetical protein [Thalassospira xianhensis]RCK07621.1 hypothetical protein TH5_00665 [Thalassospira xianhensis MCCC 1A02616]